jgi:hypothetical protein
MAKKKKRAAGESKHSKRLREALKTLGVAERDLARVRKNLRKFLNLPSVRSGPESFDNASSRLRRAMRRR